MPVGDKKASKTVCMLMDTIGTKIVGLASYTSQSEFIALCIADENERLLLLASYRPSPFREKTESEGECMGYIQ